MGFNDKIAAELSKIVYEHAAGADVSLPGSFRKFDEHTHAETGFVGFLYIEEEGSGSGGTSVFTIMGTSGMAGKDIAKGQIQSSSFVQILHFMKDHNSAVSNKQLHDDPESTDLSIIKDAIEFTEKGMAKLEDEMGGSWKHYTTGHSLGGSVASSLAVAFPDKIEQSVTFESPGVIKYWRDRAEKSKDSDFWKSHIKDYVSFPNPINTCVPHIGTVYRLHMLMHAKSSPGHIIRCTVGSGLRFIVWVSLANAVAAAAGQAQGFWAAKVGSITVKLFQLLFRRKFTPRRIKVAFKEGLTQDQASKDSRASAKGDVQVDDPGAKPMVPILKLLPERARPGFIVGFWALVTAAAANTGYVSMRTIAQINDTSAEHDIIAIAEHFDDNGEPNGATKMESWPYLKEMLAKRMPMTHFKRSIIEGMTPFHCTAYGLHNVRQRQDVLVKRASTMPGFQAAA